MNEYTLTGDYTLPSLGKVYNKEVNPNYINIMRSLDIDICNKVLNKLKYYDYTIYKLIPNK